MIDISNIVNISVSTPPSGLAPYSVNNLAIFTKDTPVGTISTFAVYSNSSDVTADWGSTSNVAKAAVAIFSQSPNILTGGGRLIVVPMVGQETLAAAVDRIKGSVYFGGFGQTFAADSTETLAAGAVAVADRKLYFVVSHDAADLDGANGLLFKIKDQKLTQVRGLFYSVSADAETFKWAYAGRAMSTNFSGSNTTQTMQLKQLAGVSSDPGITSTIYAKMAAVGADGYTSVAGRPTLVSFGANWFFDDVYNLNWFVGALEVAGFNLLGTTSNKIPQTEAGMDLLKSAYRSVCTQAVANRFVGAGQWNSPDTFGNPDDFRRNISERGYFIYSEPVALQSQADRETRAATLISVAAKFQGAIHSTSVLVYINR